MATDDFFRARLDQMIDLRHPQAVLATRLPWGAIEAAMAAKLGTKLSRSNGCRPTTCWVRTRWSLAVMSSMPVARACRCV